MIRPFESSLVRKVEDLPVLSYGCSSYGYDLRLSPKEFLVFRHIPGTVVNCKAFNPANLEPVELHCDQYGEFFILPGHSYGLGVTVEHLDIPSNITCLFIGKSTLARTGVILNTTPGEAGWKGYLTLEFSNSSAADCRIYANEGICQALFIEGEPCDVTYRDRNGKYQNQNSTVTTARV
jgi:dCTP deaminase